MREHHPKFTRAGTAMYHSLPHTPELDLREFAGMGNGTYRANSHIAQESEYEPPLDRWSDMRVPRHRHMGGKK